MKSVRYILLTFLAFAAPGFAAVTVTSPANNATVSSPVNYVATATTTTCAKGVASMGIYVSDKLIYVVDGTENNCLLIASTKDGKVLDKISGLSNPTAVTVDSSGAIYVGEVNGTNVKKFVKR